MSNEIKANIKNDLNTRKEILNKHLAKFNQFKNECKWLEAWNQLLITLNYANDTLKYSSNLLKDISQKMPQLSSEQQAKFSNLTKAGSDQPVKPPMIVIPKKQNIH